MSRFGGGTKNVSCSLCCEKYDQRELVNCFLWIFRYFETIEIKCGYRAHKKYSHESKDNCRRIVHNTKLPRIGQLIIYNLHTRKQLKHVPDTPSGQIVCPVGQGIPGALRCCLRRPRTHARVRMMHGNVQIIRFLVRHRTPMEIFLGKHTTTKHIFILIQGRQELKQQLGWGGGFSNTKTRMGKHLRYIQCSQCWSFLVRGVWTTVWIANNVDLRGQYIHYLIILQTAFWYFQILLKKHNATWFASSGTQHEHSSYLGEEYKYTGDR